MNLAIIGAGVAGLAAARLLRQRRPDLAIPIYEQSRELGRASPRAGMLASRSTTARST